jgi:hypothetical protein
MPLVGSNSVADWASLVAVALTKLNHLIGGFYMWVGPVALMSNNILHGSTLIPPHPAGSSSLLLTMSGVSSVDIVLTGGQYGYVLTGASRVRGSRLW